MHLARNKGPDPAPIDSTTATPVHLHPQLAPTTLPSSTTLPSTYSQPASVESKPPPKRKRQEKPEPKHPRVQRYCPAPNCGRALKYNFKEHFKEHLQNLFTGLVVGETDLLGCGFCHVQDPDVEEGTAFLGVTEFVKHMFDVHSLTLPDVPWDFNALFNNILLGEVNLRRVYRDLINHKDDELKREQKPYKGRPMLSWIYSTETGKLLGELQRLGGRLKGVANNPGIPATHKAEAVQADRTKGEALLAEAALHAGVHQRAPLPTPNPPAIDVEPIQQAPGEKPEFGHMGGGAYDPPQHPAAPVPSSNPNTARPQNLYTARTTQQRAGRNLNNHHLYAQGGHANQGYNPGLQAAMPMVNQVQPDRTMPPPPVPIQEMNTQPQGTLPAFQDDNGLLSDEQLDQFFRNQNFYKY